MTKHLRIILVLLAVSLIAPACASAASLSAARSSYLTVAQEGATRAHQLWWDGRRGWYRQRLHLRSRHPLATLWGSVPLFETLAGIALADPSSASQSALASFALGAERYWDPALEPAPGYAPYPGSRGRSVRTFFDDNGWLGIAFLDAFHATGNRRFLNDAVRAFSFIAAAGWDDARGGIWWSTDHPYKAGESVASATMLAAMLHQDTGDPYYLAEAHKFILWADSSFVDVGGLYVRHEADRTLMPYVQGPMIAAQAIICKTTGDRLYCTRAEALAREAAARFQLLAMGPQYDAIYVRSMLTLYGIDHDQRWYRIATKAASRALQNSRDVAGVFSRTWDGGSPVAHRIPPDMLQTHAATVSVFAWLAATPGPGE
ncbi:MAG: hypothetical protein NVS2B9_04480 [Myxococcales bacterium]